MGLWLVIVVGGGGGGLCGIFVVGLQVAIKLNEVKLS